jgi:hypothetical protein
MRTGLRRTPPLRAKGRGTTTETHRTQASLTGAPFSANVAKSSEHTVLARRTTILAEVPTRLAHGWPCKSSTTSCRGTVTCQPSWSNNNAYDLNRAQMDKNRCVAFAPRIRFDDERDHRLDSNHNQRFQQPAQNQCRWRRTISRKSPRLPASPF